MASTTFNSRSPFRPPAPPLEISALADTVRIHQATLNQIPRGTNPSPDWLRTVTTDTAAIAASLREIGPRISSIPDRSLQRNFQILSLDLECLQDRVGLIVSRVQNEERERTARQAIAPADSLSSSRGASRLSVPVAPRTGPRLGLETAPSRPSLSSTASSTPPLTPALPLFSLSSSNSSSSAVSSRPVPALPSASTPLDREALITGLLSDPNSVLCYEVPDPRVPYLRGYPAIKECQCISGFKREDARTGIPNCRGLAEDAFIREIQSKFPLSSHREIFVCSIASCFCFQELVIHAKLTALGYKVNWLLVDPIYYSGSEKGMHALADFNRLAKLIDPATTITTLPSIEHLVREGTAPPRMPDAFMAIDLGQLGESTVEAYFAKLLPMERLIESLPNPHFYLYADKRRLEMDAGSIVSDRTGTQPRAAHNTRPIVTITDVGPSGIRKKQVLGAEAWNSVNYQEDSATERKGASSEVKRSVIAPAKASAVSAETPSLFNYLSMLRDTQHAAHATIRALEFPTQEKRVEMLALVAQISQTATELLQADDIDEGMYADIYNTAFTNLSKVVELCQQLTGIDISDKIRLSATEGLTFVEWASRAHELCQKARFNCTPALLEEFETHILAYQRDINIRGTALLDGGTILHHLAQLGKPLEFIPLLAKHGADFTIQTQESRNTPLHWAIANGSMAMALEFLKHGPKGSAASDYLNKLGYGNTALHLAVGKGQEGWRALNGKIARIIVELGADINIRNDQDRNTALHIACLRRDPDMIQFLLERGALTTLRNKAGQAPGDLLTTPYEEACRILAHTSPFDLDDRQFITNQAAAQAVYARLTSRTARSSASASSPPV